MRTPPNDTLTYVNLLSVCLSKTHPAMLRASYVGLDAWGENPGLLWVRQ